MPLSDQQRDWLMLTLVPGVGTAMFIRLLARFHTAGNVLKASRGALREVVGPKLADRIAQYKDVADVAAQEKALDKWHAHVVTLEDPQYPLLLAEIYDPPLVLFVRGTLTEQDQHCVAIVGTRRASPYGIRMAERLGAGLAARGITVVSGMASGVDAAAQRGAVEAGGRTIAVLGNGVDVVYPPQNKELMDKIIAHGAVVSQFPMGTEPARGHFPYRNRIISGLSLGTVVVEAPFTSGALITARQAVDQGREVFAVPGQVGTKNSQGPHALLRDGAKLVETIEDILVELELPTQAYASRRHQQPETTPEPRRKPAPEQATADRPSRPAPAPPQAPAPAAKPSSQLERSILAAVSPEGSHVDEIAAVCRIPISEALSSLTVLELKGLIRQFSGKRFAPR